MILCPHCNQPLLRTGDGKPTWAVIANNNAHVMTCKTNWKRVMEVAKRIRERIKP